MNKESSPVITPPTGSQSDSWYVCADHLDMGLNVEWSDWSGNTRPMVQKARGAKLARSLDKTGANVQVAGIWLEMNRRGKIVGDDKEIKS